MSDALPILADTAARAAVLLIAAAVAASLLRRAAASTRHLMWFLAVAGVLALPALRIAVPEWPVLPAAAAGTEAVRRAELRAAVASQPLTPSPIAIRNRDAFTPRIGFAEALFLLWAGVAAGLLAWLAFSIRAVRRVARHARPGDARWTALLRHAQDETGIRAPVRLLVSADVAMPMTWGGRRPLLLLPEAALNWTDDRAGVVLLHELAHIRRADWLTHALARVAAALHWFNPLAWIALRAMTRERERACDDYVLAHGVRATDYAQHLLDICRAGTARAAFAVAPAMARRSELEGRLLSILAPRRRNTGRMVWRALPLLAMTATGIVAAAGPAAPAAGAADSAPPERQIAPLSNALLGDREEPAESTSPDVNALARALDDPSPSVREDAALGLALRSGPGVVDPLLRALKDPSSQVREKAAIGLAMRQQPGVVDALLEALNDADSQVREKAVIAVGLSGDPRAQRALIAALDDENDQVREKAVKALATLPVSGVIRGGIQAALDGLRARAR